jgi:hypothetical protein
MAAETPQLFFAVGRPVASKEVPDEVKLSSACKFHVGAKGAVEGGGEGGGGGGTSWRTAQGPASF